MTEVQDSLAELYPKKLSLSMSFDIDELEEQMKINKDKKSEDKSTEDTEKSTEISPEISSDTQTVVVSQTE